MNTYANITISNSRVVDSVTNGVYHDGSGAGSNWNISRNLFDNLSGNNRTAIRINPVDGMQLLDNVISNISYQGVQLAGSSNVEIRGNDISNTAKDGINIAGSTNVTVAENRIIDAQSRSGLRFYADTTNSAAYCNYIGSSVAGVSGIDLKDGVAGGVHIFDNAITGDVSITSGWTAGAAIGSNWYGGGAAAAAGTQALQLRIADPLSADPTNGGVFGVADCGDNTPVDIVAHGGTPQSTAAGTAFANPLSARVQDALGGAVMGASVSYAAPASGASAALGTASGTTNYNGELITTATANGIAGAYSVTASSGTLTPDASFALTNTQGAATVTVTGATATYDGNTHAVTVATTPTGLESDVQIVYKQGTTTVATCAATATSCGPTAAGTYTATATITGNANYTGSGTGTLTINRAATTIEFLPDPLSFVYNGGTHAVTARLAADTGTSCPVSGTVGPDVADSPYTVNAAACTGTNYEAPASSAQAAVTKAAATVTLSHLTQPHDGAPKSVLVTTDPAGLAVDVTYNGSTTPPTEVGTYTVEATVTDANHTGSATGTLEIVAGTSDIALVVNGPVDPVHVGDTAEYAATMLANPALHAGETFGYRVEFTKSGGDPLELTDLATMEVFYQGAWVDATTFFGTIPFVLDPVTHTLTYNFPEGIGNYDATNGFPIEDASWTWNVRFSFATPGTYTMSATLTDGIAGADIDPLVAASAATVVQQALPPTDIHLVMTGPTESVQANTPVDYAATMLADPGLHTGEMFDVRLTIGKAGGHHALVPADLAALDVLYMGTWQSFPLGSFSMVNGDLVLNFPTDTGMAQGFEIQDPEWTWNFRATWADTGTYTMTAQVIPHAQVGSTTPDVFASAAVTTQVVEQVIVPPTANLVLLGPVGDVQVHSPAHYTGTLLANPADFAGQDFYVRVRLSKDGGAMTAADLEKMELYLAGGWQDATAAIQGVLVPDGNDLLYYFPQPNGAFQIDESVWTWNFRFTYGDVGVYHASADLIDAAAADLKSAPSIAHAETSTNVVAQTPGISLQLQGALTGVVGQPVLYQGTLRADPLPDASKLYFVEVRLARDHGQVTPADMQKMEIFWQGQWVDPVADMGLTIPWTQDGNDLIYLFPKPVLDAGFPIDEAEWSWNFRFTYATADLYTAAATVVDATSSNTVSAPVTIQTDVTPALADISLQLNGPVAGVEQEAPAIYLGHLQNLGADLAENGYVNVRITMDGEVLAVGDVTVEVLAGGTWVPGTLTAVNDGLEVDFPDAAGFPIEAGFDWTHQFRITYHRTGTFNAAATVMGADSGNAYATATMFTEVVPQSAVTASVTFDPASLHAVYDGHAHAASATTDPVGLALEYTYNGSSTAPTSAGSYVVVATVAASAAPYQGSASAVLTIDRAQGHITFSPLTGIFGSNHAVTATLDEDAGATCTAVAGVPAANAPAGSYTVSASCTGVNHTASGTATYVVTGADAAIQPVGGPAVGVVTIDPLPNADAKKTLLTWKTTGSAPENVRAHFTITSSAPAPQAGDLALEYFETTGGTWQPLSLTFAGGQWSGDFGPTSGFPLTDGAESQFRATFHRGGRYTSTASIVGATSGLTYATSAPVAADVAGIALTGSGNAVGVIGQAVDTSYALVNNGSAALSSGGPGNPVPQQPTPNNENVRGRFIITPPAGVTLTGATGSSCGDESCTSPDVAVEFFDPDTSEYVRIYNLQSDGSGGLVGHFGAKTNGGVPVPAGYSASFLFRTTAKTYTGTYATSAQVVGISTGSVYAESNQTIGVDTGAAASIAIVSGDSGQATVGGNGYDGGNLVVEVRDSGGNPVSGASVAFNVVSGNDAGATWDAPAVTGANGQTSITASSNDFAGAFAVNATLSSGVELATPFALHNVADTDAGQVKVTADSGNGQTAQVGAAYGLPLSAKVTDRFGNPLQGVTVDFTGSGVTLANASGTTNADGLVDTGTVTAGSTAGAASVTATADGNVCNATSTDATCSATFSLTNTAGGAASIALASGATSATVGTAGAYVISATVKDGSGNPVQGISVTLVGPSSGAGVTPAIFAGLSDASGVVTHTFDANTIAGAFPVQAIASGLTTQNVQLTNVAGAAAKIVLVSGDNQWADAGTAFLENLTVRVIDQYGNAVADDAAAEVTFTAPPSGASASVTASVTSSAGGLAQTSATANYVIGSYKVTASFNGTSVEFRLMNAAGNVTVTDILWADNGATSIAFDRSPKSATATVTGSGITPTFTYDGSATAPTNAGSYLVVATVEDGGVVHGSASATLTINPAASGNTGITLAGGSFTWDGSAHAATVTNPNGVSHTLTYSTSDGNAPVNAGTYTATLTVIDSNYESETITAPITIVEVTPVLALSNLTQTYDGSPKPVTVSVTPAVLQPDVVVTYDGSTTVPSAVGSYEVVASIAATSNVNSAQVTGTLVIKPAGDGSCEIFCDRFEQGGTGVN